jgi:hypothetical protein
VKPAPLPVPDAALRSVLAGFAGAWARDAARLAARADGEGERIVYLDAFAGAEFAFGMGDPGRGEPSRAVAAARAVLEGAPERGRAVLVEEDPALLARLRAELEGAGFGDRLRAGDDPPEPGTIALVEADFRNVADVLLAFAEPTRSLLWLAPPSARRLPWTLLEAMLGDPATDVLLRFPHADYEKGGAFTGPLADLPPYARRIVEGCSALMGDGRHEWVSVWRAAARSAGPREALDATLARFRARLDAHAGERVVKEARAAAAADVLPAHLFLAAAEPASALALNAAVQGAGLADRAASPVPVVAEPEAPPPARELDLFGPPPATAAEAPPRPASADTAELLAGRHRGATLPLRAVLTALADTDLTHDEVRRALGVLRREGRAVYRSLAHPDAVVIFPEEAVLPAPRRKRRTEPPGSGDLFGPEE